MLYNAFHGVAIYSAGLFLLAGCRDRNGCQSDQDCKGSRVCEDGSCVEPPRARTAEAPPVPTSPATPRDERTVGVATVAATSVAQAPKIKPYGQARRGNVVYVNCGEGTKGVVMDGVCACGATLPVPNPCPGAAKVTTEGYNCVFTCADGPKPTCSPCTVECLDNADKIRASDPAHARELARHVCRFNCGEALPNVARCESYGFKVGGPGDDGE